MPILLAIRRTMGVTSKCNSDSCHGILPNYFCILSKSHGILLKSHHIPYNPTGTRNWRWWWRLFLQGSDRAFSWDPSPLPNSSRRESSTPTPVSSTPTTGPSSTWPNLPNRSEKRDLSSVLKWAFEDRCYSATQWDLPDLPIAGTSQFR